MRGVRASSSESGAGTEGAEEEEGLEGEGEEEEEEDLREARTVGESGSMEPGR